MPGLVAARFVSRPNRFIVMARLGSGQVVRCHMADPGRLRELLLPDADLRLRPAEPGSPRRTAWSVALVRAPMPGLVLRVDVVEGQEVAAGDGLVVLEAMKMENVIRASLGGRIKAIHVAEGTAVEKAALLVDIDPVS